MDVNKINNKKLAEYIISLRMKKNYSQRKLADVSGVSNSTISRLENALSEADPATLKKLAPHLDVDYQELMKIAGYISNGESLESKQPSDQPPEKGVKIPVIGAVAAGIPLEAIENIEDYEEISQSMASTGEYFALRIKGISMEPRFTEGDVVIVRKQDDIESGDIGVVIENGSDATVKKVIKQENGILLTATNQNVYPPKFYDNKDIETLPVKILGKVVELRAKF